MTKNAYTYLKFTDFKKLFLWDLKKSQDGCFESDYEIVKLNNLINEENTKYVISDKNSCYGILGVNNRTGLFDAYTECGAKIKQKYKKMDLGWLAYNPYRVNVGSIGIKRVEHKNDYISPAYVVFSCKSSICPEYLFLTMKTEMFNKIIKKHTTGSVRQTLSYETLKTLSIPLPTLKKQQSLVNAYNEKIEQASMLEEQIMQIESNIRNYLLSEIGINEPEHSFQENDTLNYCNGNDECKKSFCFIKFLRFKETNEWGYNAIKSNKKELSSKYPSKKVKELCLLGSGGTPSRSNPSYYQGDIPWIKTGEVINEEIFKTEEHISEDAVENSSAKPYPKGSLIIAMYGQGGTRGRTAKLGIEAATNQACAVLYNINSDLVNTDYLWYYFQCRYENLRSLASGNNQPNLNAGKINNYDVVIPPLDVQNTIVKQIYEKKNEIRKLKDQSDKLKASALVEFEKEIFG